ncbi:MULTISPECIES: HupE/UreJ family protein [Nostoc]|uniref:HupE/UreJ family protein n=1 Tax=Nostoc paludosum FACHB-159 TaxID=2692908 RepID=A0ABR8K4D1_9NOSO|nr:MULTISPECIES: HupE/UreJ family protein [Nostoc]MBD2677164.1 HupE/UreJ family protein [Nostoc sp. FACHB-857]MBD2733027.1 HupE/UreJ family protein [Nostoc paludosum FACHB-159]
MFKTKLSEFRATPEFYTLKVVDRHIAAIAALILISLLSSWSGTLAVRTISNFWEGFIWGIADPVINSKCLVGIIAIGLLSAIFIRSALIVGYFVLAVILGTIIHLFEINIPEIEIAISISTIFLGTMLINANHVNFMLLAVGSISVGLFQGYIHGQSITGTGIIPLVAYILGITLTQFAVTISIREIGIAMGMGEINRIVPRKISIIGFCLCAIAIVFLSNSIV